MKEMELCDMQKAHRPFRNLASFYLKDAEYHNLLLTSKRGGYWLSPAVVYSWFTLLVLLDSSLDWRPVCPMQTWPHSQSMLYTHEIFSPSSSCTRRSKLHIYLGDWPTLVFGQQFVVWKCDSTVADEDFTLGLDVLAVGLRAELICLRLCLKEVLRKWNSLWGLSLLHKALAVCTEVTRTAVCLTVANYVRLCQHIQV